MNESDLIRFVEEAERRGDIASAKAALLKIREMRSGEAALEERLESMPSGSILENPLARKLSEEMEYAQRQRRPGTPEYAGQARSNIREGVAAAAPYAAPIALGMALPPSIPAQMLAAGLGTAGGEAIKRSMLGQPPQPAADLKAGGMAAGGAGAAGLALKGGGLAFDKARQMLSSTPPSREAIEYATRKGLPIPGSPQALGITKRSSLGGAYAAHSAAERAGQVLDDPLASSGIARSAFTDVAEAAKSVQDTLKQTIGKIRGSVDDAYKVVENTLPDGPIRLPKSLGTLKRRWREWVDAGYVDPAKTGPERRITKALDIAGDDLSLTKGQAEQLRKDLNRIKTKSDVPEVWKTINGTDDVRGISDLFLDDYSALGASDALVTASQKAAQQSSLLRQFESRYLLNSKVDEAFQGRSYLRKLFERKGNAKARELLSQNDPKGFANARSMWVQDRLETPAFLKDGALRADKVRREWLKPNEAVMKEVFGDEGYRALDNFLAYAESSASLKPLTFGDAAVAGGATLGVAATAGPGVVPYEVGMYKLVQALNDPQSWLFRYFANPGPSTMLMTGFKPIVITAGQAGAEAARALGE